MRMARLINHAECLPGVEIGDIWDRDKFWIVIVVFQNALAKRKKQRLPPGGASEDGQQPAQCTVGWGIHLVPIRCGRVGKEEKVVHSLLADRAEPIVPCLVGRVLCSRPAATFKRSIAFCRMTAQSQCHYGSSRQHGA